MFSGLILLYICTAVQCIGAEGGETPGSARINDDHRSMFYLRAWRFAKRMHGQLKKLTPTAAVLSIDPGTQAQQAYLRCV